MGITEQQTTVIKFNEATLVVVATRSVRALRVHVAITVIVFVVCGSV